MALRPAGLIGKVVHQKRIAQSIQCRKFGWISACRCRKRHRCPRRLVNARLHEFDQPPLTIHLSGLPCRFQTTGMTESPGRKRGVGQLPQQKIISITTCFHLDLQPFSNIRGAPKMGRFVPAAQRLFKAFA